MATRKVNYSNEEASKQRETERKGWGDPATVRCALGFFDGTLVPFFQELGQDPHIAHNEIRTLPAWLLERCIQSGGRFEQANDTSKDL